MDELQFKAAYVTNFLSSYMAGRYDSDCAQGHPGNPYNFQPIEDAQFLAQCAWEQIVKAKEDGYLKTVNNESIFKV